MGYEASAHAAAYWYADEPLSSLLPFLSCTVPFWKLIRYTLGEYDASWEPAFAFKGKLFSAGAKKACDNFCHASADTRMYYSISL